MDVAREDVAGGKDDETLVVDAADVLAGDLDGALAQAAQAHLGDARVVVVVAQDGPRSDDLVEVRVAELERGGGEVAAEAVAPVRHEPLGDD